MEIPLIIIIIIIIINYLSVLVSFEQKPPLPPDKSVQRSGDKIASSKSQDKLVPKTSKAPPLQSPRGTSSSSWKSSAGPQDGLGADDEEEETSIVEQLKDMGTK